MYSPGKRSGVRGWTGVLLVWCAVMARVQHTGGADTEDISAREGRRYETEDAVVVEAATSLESRPQSDAENELTPPALDHGPLHRQKRQFGGWPGVLPIGPCFTSRGLFGQCTSFRRCYPYFKLPELSNWDTWVLGMYDTCSYFTASGRQKFGVCCSNPSPPAPPQDSPTTPPIVVAPEEPSPPATVPSTTKPIKTPINPGNPIPPNWPPPIPTHPPDHTIPPLPTHPPSPGWPGLPIATQPPIAPPAPPPEHPVIVAPPAPPQPRPPAVQPPPAWPPAMITHPPARPPGGQPLPVWPPPFITHPPPRPPTAPPVAVTHPPPRPPPTPAPWPPAMITHPPPRPPGTPPALPPRPPPTSPAPPPAWPPAIITHPPPRPPAVAQPPSPIASPEEPGNVILGDGSCGAKNGYQDQERIVGGQNADLGEWPWIAALFNGARQFCGGSLITNKHILTAAHCVAHMSSWDVARLTVKLGDHNIKTNTETIHIEKKVQRVVRHRGFDSRTLYNDIAILTMDSAVTFTKQVKPICLPTGSALYNGQTATVIGWGSLRESGPQPSILQEVNIPIWTNAECKAKYGNAAPGGIVEHFLCAGQAGRDSCSGDSGGPLTINSGRWTQVGIVSWGIGCGKGQYPGVYTRVTFFMPWITKNLK